MEKISYNVDKNLEEVYIKLLRKSLEHPEEWDLYDHWRNDYRSPNINDHGVFFLTDGRSHNYDSEFHICQRHPNGNTTKIHEIKIPFWDFKTPKLLRKLHKFMPNKEKWEKTQKTQKTLKELLGIEFDRYAKIMKIKKKI